TGAVVRTGRRRGRCSQQKPSPLPSTMQRSPLSVVAATVLGLAAFAPSAPAQTLTYGNCTLHCPVFAYPDGSTPLLFLAVTTWGNTWTPFADFDDPNAGPFPRVRLKLRTIYSFN